MKSIIFTYLITLFLMFASIAALPSSVLAQTCPVATCNSGCTSVGQCIGGFTCGITGSRDEQVLDLTGTRCGGGVGDAMLGGIYAPAGVRQYSDGVDSVGGRRIGLVSFASVLLRILTIISGLWFMFNMIYAGYLFLASSGDTGVFNTFKESLFYSLIGLFIIATAYLIAGLAGSIFFGDPGFIIRPTLFQATGTP